MCRYDFENKNATDANAMMSLLTFLCSASPEQLEAHVKATVPVELTDKLKYEKIDIFNYTDPVDGSVAKNQGIRLFFDKGRAIWRLSGTLRCSRSCCCNSNCCCSRFISTSCSSCCGRWGGGWMSGATRIFSFFFFEQKEEQREAPLRCSIFIMSAAGRK